MYKYTTWQYLSLPNLYRTVFELYYMYMNMKWSKKKIFNIYNIFYESKITLVLKWRILSLILGNTIWIAMRIGNSCLTNTKMSQQQILCIFIYSINIDSLIKLKSLSCKSILLQYNWNATKHYNKISVWLFAFSYISF